MEKELSRLDRKNEELEIQVKKIYKENSDSICILKVKFDEIKESLEQMGENTNSQIENNR